MVYNKPEKTTHANVKKQAMNVKNKLAKRRELVAVAAGVPRLLPSVAAQSSFGRSIAAMV